MHNKLIGYTLVYAVLSSILASVYPVLDEESYLYIAQSLSLSRPYDWLLPWPPYTDSYRYAHPPLFLYWMWCGQYFFWSFYFLDEACVGASISSSAWLLCWLVSDASHAQTPAELVFARMDIFTHCAYGWCSLDDARLNVLCVGGGFDGIVYIFSRGE